jgi:hypothetical protein
MNEKLTKTAGKKKKIFKIENCKFKTPKLPKNAPNLGEKSKKTSKRWGILDSKFNTAVNNIISDLIVAFIALVHLPKQYFQTKMVFQ